MSECVGIWLYFVGFKIHLEGFRTWWSHRMLVIPITVSWGTRRLGWVTVQEDTQRYGSFQLQWHHITCKILPGFPFNFSLKLWDNIWGEGLGTRARTFGAPWLAFSMANIWWLKYCCSCSLARLIQNCSKLLWSKFSKPKMSRIPGRGRGGGGGEWKIQYLVNGQCHRMRALS